MSGYRQLERRAATAVAPASAVGIDELDLILTDCASEALWLRAEQLRVSRCLAAVLGEAGGEVESAGSARELAARAGELSTRSERLRGLLAELRQRRDGLATR